MSVHAHAHSFPALRPADGNDAPYSQGALITWLDANDLSVGAGTTWTDKSSAGNNGTFVASPTISDGWTGSRRMVTFNGSTQCLTVNGIASSVSGNDKAFSLALVYQLTADAATYYGIWAFNRASSATPKMEFYKNNTTGAQFTAFNQGDTGAAAAVNAGASNTSAQVLVVSHTGTAFSAWFNGALVHNGASDADSKTLDLFTVGGLRRAGVLSFPCPMRLTEVLAWPSAIGSVGAAAEYARLAPKWGL